MPIVKYYGKINGTPALPLALEAWTDLIQTGFNGGYIPNDISTVEAIVYNISPAEQTLIDDYNIAIMTFYNYGKECIFIDAGWVKHHYRGKGYYSILWDYIIKLAKQRNKKYVCSWIIPNNYKMREIAKLQGRTEEFIMHEGREIIETTFLIK